MSSYKQLTQHQRYQIYALLKRGHNQKEIADTIEVDKSTISRELKRNRGQRGYRPKQAQGKAMMSRRKRERRRINLQTWAWVAEKISEDWSPEQIKLWMKANAETSVSHEWIYHYLVTLVDRMSRYTLIKKIDQRTASVTKTAIIHLLQPYKLKTLTSTFDNGREFTAYQDMARELETEVYFAHPYASWKRGTNENTNGLLRQYFPKGSDFSKVTDKQVKFAEIRLNTRPRKCLDARTPEVAFFEIDHVALDSVSEQ